MDVSYVYDKDELKALLPVAVAASELGVQFGADGRALCPFHDDAKTPNLELMPPGDDGYEWWYCRACGAAGDVIALYQRVLGIEFYEALLHASATLDGLPRTERLRPAKHRRAAMVPEQSWEDQLDEYRQRAEGHAQVGLLSYAYGITTDATSAEEREAWDRHLISWGWCLDPAAQIVIPHRDSAGKLVAVKLKRRDGAWRTYGSLTALYGSHRAAGTDAAFVCEGESDAVVADRELNSGDCQRVDVLALPAGADSMREDWPDVLGEYRSVVLAFDGDGAGRKAIKKWTRLLADRACDVFDARLPDGEDVRSVGVLPSELMREAVPATEELGA